MGEQQIISDYKAVDDKLRKNMLDTKAKIVSQSVYLFMVIFTFFDMFELKKQLDICFQKCKFCIYNFKIS